MADCPRYAIHDIVVGLVQNLVGIDAAVLAVTLPERG